MADWIESTARALAVKLFQKLPGSRASSFTEIDAPALLPLPLQRYEISVKVNIDCVMAGGIQTPLIVPLGLR